MGKGGVGVRGSLQCFCGERALQGGQTVPLLLLPHHATRDERMHPACMIERVCACARRLPPPPPPPRSSYVGRDADCVRRRAERFHGQADLGGARCGGRGSGGRHGFRQCDARARAGGRCGRAGRAHAEGHRERKRSGSRGQTFPSPRARASFSQHLNHLLFSCQQRLHLRTRVVCGGGVPVV